MFRSAELRWFIEGAPDKAVIEWFRRSALAAEEDPRIDSYLLLPGCASAGVKVRQGHLEVKALTSLPEPVHYDNGLSGRRASWVKWSSGIAGAPLLEARKGPETWVQVQKSRTLLLFDLRSDEPQETAPGAWLDGAGCFVELTALRSLADSADWASATDWWSLCLEAFGDDAMESLDRMASADRMSPVGENLPGESSMSYPEWLCRNFDAFPGR